LICSLWATKSYLFTLTNNNQPPSQEGYRTMLWRNFIYSLCAEGLKSGFSASDGQQVELTITVSPKGKKDPDGNHLYRRSEKLKILVLEIRQASSEQITLFCTLIEPLPLGFKPGNYTLRFVIVDDDYICGGRPEDIEQMLLDGKIPAAAWSLLRREGTQK
jgi:hypothetical protein